MADFLVCRCLVASFSLASVCGFDVVSIVEMSDVLNETVWLNNDSYERDVWREEEETKVAFMSFLGCQHGKTLDRHGVPRPPSGHHPRLSDL